MANMEAGKDPGSVAREAASPKPSPGRSGRFTVDERRILVSLIWEDDHVLSAFCHQQRKQNIQGKSFMHLVTDRFNEKTNQKRSHDAVRHHLKLRRANLTPHVEDQKKMTQTERDFRMLEKLLEHRWVCTSQNSCTRCLQMHRLRVQRGLARCSYGPCTLCNDNLPLVREPFDARDLLTYIRKRFYSVPDDPSLTLHSLSGACREPLSHEDLASPLQYPSQHLRKTSRLPGPNYPLAYQHYHAPHVTGLAPMPYVTTPVTTPNGGLCSSISYGFTDQAHNFQQMPPQDHQLEKRIADTSYTDLFELEFGKSFAPIDFKVDENTGSLRNSGFATQRLGPSATPRTSHLDYHHQHYYQHSSRQNSSGSATNSSNKSQQTSRGLAQLLSMSPREDRRFSAGTTDAGFESSEFLSLGSPNPAQEGSPAKRARRIKVDDDTSSSRSSSSPSAATVVPLPMPPPPPAHHVFAVAGFGDSPPVSPVSTILPGILASPNNKKKRGLSAVDMAPLPSSATVPGDAFFADNGPL